MAVTLLSLIKAAPFKEETRQQLLANLDKLTPEQRFELSETCWTVLSQLYFRHLKYEQDKLMLEIQEGKRKYNKKDFDDVEEKVNQEFTGKLKSSQTEESIESVREELQKQLRKPS